MRLFKKMIFLSNADGTITAAVPQAIYQGSSQANEVVLIGPFSTASVVSVSFKLPNGQILKPRLTENVDGDFNMTELPNFAGKFFDANGTGYRAWRLELDAAITAIPGAVTLQFFVAKGTAPNGKPIILPTSSTTINIGAGVAYLPVDFNEANWGDITTAVTMAQNAAEEAEQAKQDILNLNPLEKLDVPRIVYATDERGKQKYFYYSTGASQSTFPIRGLKGQMAAPDQEKNAPGEDEYISKRFGDLKYVSKTDAPDVVYGNPDIPSKPGYFPLDTNLQKGDLRVGNVSYVATRKTNAQFWVPDAPVEENDATSKKYVDAKYNSIGAAFHFKDVVSTYGDLPSDASNGDVYQVEAAYGSYPAGTNFAWNGQEWKPIGGDEAQIFDDLATIHKELNKTEKWDLIIDDIRNFTYDYIKSQNLKANARVHVAVHFPDRVKATFLLPENVQFIDFSGCTYGNNIVLDMTASLDPNVQKNNQLQAHISNLTLNNLSNNNFVRIDGFGFVEHCGCSITARETTENTNEIIITGDVSLVTNCTATSIGTCANVSNCILVGLQKDGVYHNANLSYCHNISNIIIYGYADITNCENLTNIYGNATYTNCTYVDGDTCDGYYTSEDAGKVQVITADGSKETKEYVPLVKGARGRVYVINSSGKQTTLGYDDLTSVRMSGSVLGLRNARGQFRAPSPNSYPQNLSSPDDWEPELDEYVSRRFLEQYANSNVKQEITAYMQYTGEGTKSEYIIPQNEYGIFNIICGQGCDITFNYKSGNSTKTYSLSTDAGDTKTHITVYKYQFYIKDYGYEPRTVQGIVLYFAGPLQNASTSGCHTKFNLISDISIIPNITNGTPAIPLILRQKMNSEPYLYPAE